VVSSWRRDDGHGGFRFAKALYQGNRRYSSRRCVSDRAPRYGAPDSQRRGWHHFAPYLSIGTRRFALPIMLAPARRTGHYARRADGEELALVKGGGALSCAVLTAGALMSACSDEPSARQSFEVCDRTLTVLPGLGRIRVGGPLWRYGRPHDLSRRADGGHACPPDS
jgi:hypothetical protein